MEILREVVEGFLLFNFIEALVYCFIFYFVFGCEKFRLYEVVLIGVVNSIITSIFPPLVYQIFIILFYYMVIKSKSKNSKKNSFILAISSLVIMLIMDMTYSITLEAIGIYLFEIDNLSLSIYLIFLRIIEIFIVIGGREKMKKAIWFGSIEKPVKKNK